MKTRPWSVVVLLFALAAVSVSTLATVHAQPSRPTRVPPAIPTINVPTIPQVQDLPSFATPVPGAVSSMVEDVLGDVSADLQALEDLLLSLPLPSAIIIEGSAGAYTAQLTLPETQINTLVMRALAPTPYAGTSVDLIPGGATITIPNVTVNAQASGTLVFTVMVTLQNGAFDVVVTQAAVNGISLPVSMLDPILASLETLMNAYVSAALSAMNADMNISYYVSSLIITASDLTVTANVQTSAVPTRPGRGG